MTLAFIFMYLSKSLIVAILSCILYEISLSMKLTSFAAWINDILPNNSRASLLSAISTFANLANTFMFIFVGHLVELLDIQIVSLFVAIVSLFGAIMFYRLKLISKTINLELSKFNV
ncbi:hypothetical protein BBF96_13865 [Anoxybacter fermentans]|uniref:Major facilitator superfamily (MFS) profile domain-containing protein n=2 Tax=Anoxybacter fermentans TaxID=1323375 RepID=A0A3Q9HRY9_9FIRM|nr:hypothetical protein BBF96_13865 [Anoxybacter fermentans]